MCCRLRRKLMLMLAVMLVLGSGLLLGHYIQYGKGEQVHKKALEKAAPADQTGVPVLVELSQPETPLAQLPEETVAVIPPDEQAIALASLNIAALQEENPDVMGWIIIPGTKIDYPLMSSDSSDEYLHTAWDGSYSYAGSIYLEHQNSQDLSDFHTIVYGHNMKNGTMFGNLIGYSDLNFRNDHPYVYVLAGDTVFRYQVFSAYTADITGDTYRIGFRSPERKAQAVSYYLESSVIDTGVAVDENSRILTLSTCTGMGDYSQRWVVQAVLCASWKITE